MAFIMSLVACVGKTVFNLRSLLITEERNMACMLRATHRSEL